MRLVHLFSVASVCAALAACDSPVPASTAAPVDAAPEASTADALVVPWNAIDVGRSLDRYAEQLRGLEPQTLEELASAASAITRNCPYNRSSVALPLTVQVVLARHEALLNDPDFLSVAPEAARQLDGMVANASTWTSIYTALSVADLPAPVPGDYLHGAGLVTAADLQTPDAALAAMGLTLAAVQGLVDAYDPTTLATIDSANASLSDAFGGGWPLKIEVIAFRNSIEEVMAEARMRSTSPPEELQAAFAALDRDMLALKGLIDTFVALRC